MPKTADTFATRLRRIRVEAGLSIYALAAKCGISRQHLGRLESGKRQPTLVAAKKIAHALGHGVETFD